MFSTWPKVLDLLGASLGSAVTFAGALYLSNTQKRDADERILNEKKPIILLGSMIYHFTAEEENLTIDNALKLLDRPEIKIINGGTTPVFNIELLFKLEFTDTDSNDSKLSLNSNDEKITLKYGNKSLFFYENHLRYKNIENIILPMDNISVKTPDSVVRIITYIITEYYIQDNFSTRTKVKCIVSYDDYNYRRCTQYFYINISDFSKITLEKDLSFSNVNLRISFDKTDE